MKKEKTNTGDIMEDLIRELKELSELTKDYNKFCHLFSDDDGKRTLAEIRRVARQIELRVDFSKIKKVGHPKNKALHTNDLTGRFVKVRPCDEKYGNKTYLGIMIGDVALSSSISIEDDKIICSWEYHNPAIVIPEIGAVVYGAESWWGIIKCEDDLKDITNKDINNTWYVKALKTL